MIAIELRRGNRQTNDASLLLNWTYLLKTTRQTNRQTRDQR